MAALIAYVPALHKGYIDFFKKYSDELFILGKDIVLEQPRMDRDIRAMDPADVKTVVEALTIFKRVTILTKENVGELQKIEGEICMPDEDVSRLFVESYLKIKEKEITFIPIFLRWDRNASLKTNVPVNPHRVISTNAFDKEMIEKAYSLTAKSSDWWRNIGAVSVKDKKIVLMGYNHPLPNDQVHNILGDPRSNFDAGVSFELSKFLHAEAGVIAEAAKRGITLEGTEMYVTTFPCPVCAKSIAAAGIKKVYYTEGYSLLDAEDILNSFGIEIVQVKRS